MTTPKQTKGRKPAEKQGNAPETARQLRTHEALAAVRPLDVANLAATLLRDGGEPTDAILKAYTLLDIAEHCNLSLKLEASVEAGISSYKKGVAVDDEFYQDMEEMPHYTYQVDENGKKQPVPFDTGLGVLIPLPPSTKDKPGERMSRFKRFLSQYDREEHPEKDELERMIEVGGRIEEMKKSGIPAKLFSHAIVLFGKWWRISETERLQEAGKKGQAAKGRNRRKKP